MFWHYFWEIVLGAFSIFCALAMLSHRAIRSRWSRRFGRNRETYVAPSGNVHTIGSYLVPLHAWVPVWIIGHFFWEWLTGHETYGYPNFFWWWYVSGWLMSAASLGKSVRLQKYVKLIGSILVICAVWNLGWFNPWGLYIHLGFWSKLFILLGLVLLLLASRFGGIIAVVAGLLVLALVGGVMWLNNDIGAKGGVTISGGNGNGSSSGNGGSTAKPDVLGAFNSNAAANKQAPKLSQTVLTPQGTRGSCWPSNTFNHTGAQAEVVTYLQGKDARDKYKTFKVVNERDTAWLTSYQEYYHYSPAQSDAEWHQGLVLKQLTYPITVMDTYCPDGQNNIQQWQVQTLQKDEWVYFLKGHAPGDGTNIIPVRKANCGNFLLPPPQTKVVQKVVTKTPQVIKKVHRRPHRTPHGPPTCKTNCKPRPPVVCVKPSHIPVGYGWDSKLCKLYKLPQSKNCMLNNIGCSVPNRAVQPVQHNPGQPIGKTPGASTSAPAPAPQGPQPSSGTKAPDPNPSGYNSGSNSGSGTAGGTTCDSSGCSGGGATSGSGATDGSNSGDNNGTDGSGNSTGGGTVTNPFG